MEHLNMNGNGGLLDMDEHDDDFLKNAMVDRGDLAPGVADPEHMRDPPKIRVVVRTRPINAREIDKGDEDIVGVDMEAGQLLVNEPRQKVDLTKYTERHKFIFDDVLDHYVDNDDVYIHTVQSLVHTIFKLGKATCFAYGQTGSGKTYTMSPLPPRAAAEILTLLQSPRYSDLALFVSCFEIYGGKVYDLLNGRKKLTVLEDAKRKVNVVGLKEFHVEEQQLVEQLIDHGAAARCTGMTGANAESSRSHSIMQFSLKKPKKDGEPGGREVGRMSFIDLAGSERGADTFDNDRQTRLEGAEINKSLLALKECIRALDGGAGHVPFRGSKLTEVLRDSFVGAQARTVMIANISPGSSSVEHTLNTLRYADRVKELRKDKAMRNPGGVTPGNNYNAAALRVEPPEYKPRPPPQPSPPPTAAPPPIPTGPINPATQPFVPRPAASASDRAPPPREQAYSQAQQRQAQQQQQQQQQQPLRDANVGPRGSAREAAAERASASAATREAEATAAATGAAAAAFASENDAESLLSARDDLMNTILEEEDELMQCHRRQIEDTMDIVRSEMNLLAQVDQPGSAIDAYVDTLGAILKDKAASIQQLQAKLDSFKAKLREEEIMSRTMGQQHKR